MFEWDERKSKECAELRGFDFSIVYEFDFETAMIVEDDRHDYGETRFKAFNTIGDKLYNVVFTVRGSRLRIISVRRVRKREGKRYGF